MNYYNEIDKHAAAWLRELIRANLIAEGDVDERTIVDVSPADLTGYTQCHFFAGIGGWPIALRQAGWPDDRPVWTGSCPCQPFSSAGRRKGFSDERHLWPEFYRLIKECRPNVCFGEQVASKDGLSWIDSVCIDLEKEDYTVGAVDTCAAGFGAPHIRQRLYWVAYSEWLGRGRRSTPDDSEDAGQIQTPRYGTSCGMAYACSWEHEGSILGYGKVDGASSADRMSEDAARCGTAHGMAYSASNRRFGEGQGRQAEEGRQQRSEQAGIIPHGSEGLCATGRLADTECNGLETYSERKQIESPSDLSKYGRMADSTGEQKYKKQQRPTEIERERQAKCPCGCGMDCGMADSDIKRSQGRIRNAECANECALGENGLVDRPGPTNGFWANTDWLFCKDNKWRPVESGLEPLADGIQHRTPLLRGYGNAIVVPQAQAFIESFMEVEKEIQ